MVSVSYRGKGVQDGEVNVQVKARGRGDGALATGGEGGRCRTVELMFRLRGGGCSMADQNPGKSERE